MSIVSIFSSSNREDNKSILFAQLCADLLEDQGVESQIYDFKNLPADVSLMKMYDFDNPATNAIVEKYLTSVDKLIFIIPEYNGSFPGILKLFIDAIHPTHFKNKKAALLGISAGKAGNLRGMDHITSILNYLKVHVYHEKVPISSIDALISENNILDGDTRKRIKSLIEDFLNY